MILSFRQSLRSSGYVKVTMPLFIRSYEPGILRLSDHAKAELLFWNLFARILPGRATTTDRLHDYEREH